MMNARVSRAAFTLVELVVVVLILGILGAIAAPRAYQAATQATDNGAMKSLRSIRDAIDYFKLENGELPGTGGTEVEFKKDLGPYLRSKTFPLCPVGPAKNGDINMVADTTPIVGDDIPTQGWAYSYKSGQFVINFSAATASDPTVNYDEL